MEVSRYVLDRKLKRARAYVEYYEKLDKECTLSEHGRWSLGYYQGMVSAYEAVEDMSEVVEVMDIDFGIEILTNGDKQ